MGRSFILQNAFVSWGIHTHKHKLLQTAAIHLLYLAVLEGGSLKLRCDKGHTLSEGSRRRFTLASSSLWWLSAFPMGSLQFVSVLTWPILLLSVSLLWRSLVIEFNAWMDNSRWCHLKILNFITSATKSPFPNKVTIIVLGVNIYFCGPPFNPIHKINKGSGLRSPQVCTQVPPTCVHAVMIHGWYQVKFTWFWAT
jgi:hypothetical protein